MRSLPVIAFSHQAHTEPTTAMSHNRDVSVTLRGFLYTCSLNGTEQFFYAFCCAKGAADRPLYERCPHVHMKKHLKDSFFDYVDVVVCIETNI